MNLFAFMPVPQYFRKILVFMKGFLEEKNVSLMQTSQENGCSEILCLTRLICKRKNTIDE